MIGSGKKLVGDLLKRTRSAGSELRDGVESLRVRIRDLNRQRASIAAAPIDRETAEMRIDDFIASTVLQHDSVARSPSPARFTGPAGDYAPPENVDRAHMMFVYFAPQLAASMKDDLARFYETNEGLTEHDRAERIATLDAERLEVELAEEAIIRGAEASGFPIFRRHDADPRAVLASERALP